MNDIVLHEAASPPAFDYSALDAGQAKNLRRTAADIRGHQRQIGVFIIEIGLALIEARARLPHGQFGKWLDAEFGWTDRTARNFMMAAERFEGKTEIISDLPATTIYALASPTTPDSVIEEIKSSRERGQPLRVQAVNDLVAEARARRREEAAEAKLTAKARAQKARAKEERHRAWEAHMSEMSARQARMAEAAGQAAAWVAARGDARELLTLLRPTPDLSAADEFIKALERVAARQSK